MILRECGRLSRLTQDMLQLAGADHQNLSLRLEAVNPEAPVMSAYESFQELATAKHITMTLDMPSTALPKVSCDRQRIEQLLAILLDNAIRHTPEGGRVTLGVQAAKRQVRFTVADNGSGIPDEQKRLVFERFYQGDSSRSDKEHYGLGLSIAAEIADLHKGKLTVEDAADGGCLFTLSVPL
jgi:signal transduction histidine kinase